jgi:hypothetical protein
MPVAPASLRYGFPVVGSHRRLVQFLLSATEHVYNLTNIGLNIHSDMLCDISRKNRSRSPK